MPNQPAGCLRLVFFLLFVAFTRQATAQPPAESCIQCKFADCLKGLADQKDAIAAGYDRLAAKWSKLTLVEGKPAYDVDFRTIRTTADRNSFYLDFLKRHEAFDKEVDDMVNGVGPAQGCGFTGASEVSTDSFVTCKTNQPSLKSAQAGSPCKEVAEMLDRHERIHRQACDTRVQKGLWTYVVSGNGVTLDRPAPNIAFTPAGKAREEATAYRYEAAALRKLHEQALAKCKITQETTGGDRSGQRLAQNDRVRNAADRLASYAIALR